MLQHYCYYLTTLHTKWQNNSGLYKFWYTILSLLESLEPDVLHKYP